LSNFNLKIFNFVVFELPRYVTLLIIEFLNLYGNIFSRFNEEIKRNRLSAENLNDFVYYFENYEILTDYTVLSLFLYDCCMFLVLFVSI
jgi:hypothetical protein